MSRLLLVEDEERLARSVSIGLRDESFLVDIARDGAEALWFASASHHDAIVLDLRLPKLDGLEVCRRIRAAGAKTPILMLTACDTTQDIVTGLQAGGDDYLTKPFAFAELLARLRALLRRASAAGSGILRFEELELDADAHTANRAGVALALTKMEFRLLELLLRGAGCVQSRARIAAALWDDDLGPDSNVIEVLVSNLRRKIDRGSGRPVIQTCRGVGYVLRRAEA